MHNPAASIDQLVARTNRLHSLPGVAMKVLELTENPQVDVGALKRCIENDPALTTKILRVVNSSLFGLSREVSDLNQALALLGSKPLKLLVLGFSLPPGLFEGIEADVLQRYWSHTLIKAVAAREICETYWNQPGDDAFIGGLLQDVGVLVLIQELGTPYVELLEKIYDSGWDLAALEQESLGFDHTALTARLLGHWGLPDVLVHAVCWKTALQATQSIPTSQRTLPQILHLAELISRLLADGRADVLAELLVAAREYCNLGQQQVDQLIASLEEKVAQLADVLSLQLPEGSSYTDIVTRAHDQLSAVAASAAEDLIAARTAAQRAEADQEEQLHAELESLSEALAAMKAAPPPEPAQPETDQAAPAGEAVDRAPAATRSRPQEAVIVAERPGNPAARVEIDPALPAQLATAVTACRRARCALSLMLVEVDEGDEVAFRSGVQKLGSLRADLQAACAEIDFHCKVWLPYGEFGAAVILGGCDRSEAKGLARQLIDQFRDRSDAAPFGGGHPRSLSVGVATVSLPPPNFPPRDLLDAAARCLYGSQVSGGGVVKSIEIY
jgi:HD-like signal output (HDOD) protein